MIPDRTQSVTYDIHPNGCISIVHGYLRIHKMCLRCLSMEWAPLDKTPNDNRDEMTHLCILLLSDTCSLSTFPPKHDLDLC